MKTISDYTIYCTPEQTLKAIKLGAPIEATWKETTNSYIVFEDDVIPTAEQMIGWLETQGFGFSIDKLSVIYQSYVTYNGISNKIADISYNKSRKEATLVVIDAALEYLANK